MRRSRFQGFRVLAHAIPTGVAVLCAACASAPPRAPVPAQPAPSPPNGTAAGSEAVAAALGYEGVPYRYGGTDRRGMDCSGFVWRVFRDLGVTLPRTSSDQFRRGEPVERARLREGDLVFFVTSGGTVSHVGISMGGTAFIHASTGSKRVRVDDLTNPYFAAHYRGARRLLR